MKLCFRSDAYGSKESRNAPLPFLMLIPALTLVFMTFLTPSLANAPLHEPTTCLIEVSPSLLTATDDWRVVADTNTGLALLLPPSHDLAPSGDTWYVYGTLDGEPLVPDVFMQLHRNQSVEDVAGELFAMGVMLQPVRLGPATRGFRVVDPDRTGADGYLVGGEEGTYSIVRYEDFDWAGFDQVACSFHFIELVSGQD